MSTYHCSYVCDTSMKAVCVVGLYVNAKALLIIDMDELSLVTNRLLSLATDISFCVSESVRL